MARRSREMGAACGDAPGRGPHQLGEVLQPLAGQSVLGFMNEPQPIIVQSYVLRSWDITVHRRGDQYFARAQRGDLVLFSRRCDSPRTPRDEIERKINRHDLTEGL